MRTPLISVIIPAYNAAATIGRALASVAQQEYSPLEIIVVDDASTDDTAAVVEASPMPVKLVHLERNAGAAGARNIGIEHATGELVAFLDADDEWLPGKLAKQVSILAAEPGASFVACNASLVTVDGLYRERLYGELPPARGPEAWRTLLAYNFVATPTVLARRAALDEVGRFNPDLVLGEDQDLWIRLASRGSLEYLDEVLVVVHAQNNSLSFRMSAAEADAAMQMILRHIEAQRSRLTPAEINFILGHRYTKMGRNLYHAAPASGMKLLARAIRLGHKPGENLWYLFTASPPMRLVKSLLGRAA